MKKREITFPKNISYIKPFIKVVDGYGYEGVLLTDKKTGELQCHLCGKWKFNLTTHIAQSHKMRAYDYKDKFGLAYQTALISEQIREKLIKAAVRYPWEKNPFYRINKERKNKGYNVKIKNSDRNKGKYTMEFKNKKGLCSLQMIDRLEKLSEKLGRQPYDHEMITERGTNFRKAIVSTFGSIKEVRRILQMRGHNYFDVKKIHTKESIIKDLLKFKKLYGREPFSSDCKRGILPSIHAFVTYFGSFVDAKLIAYHNDKYK